MFVVRYVEKRKETDVKVKVLGEYGHEFTKGARQMRKKPQGSYVGHDRWHIDYDAGGWGGGKPCTRSYDHHGNVYDVSWWRTEREMMGEVEEFKKSHPRTVSQRIRRWLGI